MKPIFQERQKERDFPDKNEKLKFDLKIKEINKDNLLKVLQYILSSKAYGDSDLERVIFSYSAYLEKMKKNDNFKRIIYDPRVIAALIKTKDPSYIVQDSRVAFSLTKIIIQHASIENIYCPDEKGVFTFLEFSEKIINRYQKLKKNVKIVDIYCSGFSNIIDIADDLPLEDDKHYFFYVYEPFNLVIEKKTSDYIRLLKRNGKNIHISLYMDKKPPVYEILQDFNGQTIISVFNLIQEDILELSSVPKKRILQLYEGLTGNPNVYSEFSFDEVINLIESLSRICNSQGLRFFKLFLFFKDIAEKLRGEKNFFWPGIKHEFFEFLCHFGIFPLCELVDDDYDYYKEMAKKHSDIFKQMLLNNFIYMKRDENNINFYKNFYLIAKNFINFNDLSYKEKYFISTSDIILYLSDEEFIDLFSKMPELMNPDYISNLTQPYSREISIKFWNNFFYVLKRIIFLEKREALDFYLKMKSNWNNYKSDKKLDFRQKHFFTTLSSTTIRNEFYNPIVEVIIPTVLKTFYDINVGLD